MLLSALVQRPSIARPTLALHLRRIDRSGKGCADSRCQNGRDLVAAKRRQVQALVRPNAFLMPFLTPTWHSFHDLRSFATVRHSTSAGLCSSATDLPLMCHPRCWFATVRLSIDRDACSTSTARHFVCDDVCVTATTEHSARSDLCSFATRLLPTCIVLQSMGGMQHSICNDVYLLAPCNTQSATMFTRLARRATQTATVRIRSRRSDTQSGTMFIRLA